MFAGEPPDGEAMLDADPELAMFVEAHTFEVGELLLNPDAARLSRFAFRRAAEAAARGAAAEAGGWLRLVSQLDRARPRLERDMQPFSDADQIRARYAADLRAAYESTQDGDEDGDDD